MEHLKLIFGLGTVPPADAVVIWILFLAGVLHLFEKWRFADYLRYFLNWYCEFCIGFWLSALSLAACGYGIFAIIVYGVAIAAAAAYISFRLNYK